MDEPQRRQRVVVVIGHGDRGVVAAEVAAGQLGGGSDGALSLSGDVGEGAEG